MTNPDNIPPAAREAIREAVTMALLAHRKNQHEICVHKISESLESAIAPYLAPGAPTPATVDEGTAERALTNARMALLALELCEPEAIRKHLRTPNAIKESLYVRNQLSAARVALDNCIADLSAAALRVPEGKEGGK